MTKQHQVVARFKSPDSSPRFTKSCNIDELMARLMQELPVDALYMVIPHDDGLGYNLRELGYLSLNVVTRDQIEAEPAPTSSPQEPEQIPAEAAHWMAADLGPRPVVAPESKVFTQPTLDPGPQPFTPIQAEMRGGMTFDRPRSQKELLREKGIQDPPNHMYGVRGPKDRSNAVPQEPEPAQKATPKKQAKPKKAKISKRKDAELSSEADDSNLPNTVSKGGRRVVNSISTATPEEAAAASQFRGF